MASGYLVNVPKLKGKENYDDWAFAAQNFLILEGLSKYIEHVTGSVPTAEEANEDAKAKAKLILTIDPTIYVHIKESRTARELWTKLKQMFDDSGFSRRISLLRSLISTRLENCDSMGSYVTQIVETAQRLRGTGFNIDEEWIGSLLLAGLPNKYMPMIMAIEHSGIAITADAIKTKLLDMEGGSVDNAGSALFVKNGNGARFKSSTVNKAPKDVSQRKEIKCYKCHQIGHFKSKCPLLNPSSGRNSDTHKRTSNLFSVVFASGNFNRSDWYIDSGVTLQPT